MPVPRDKGNLSIPNLILCFVFFIPDLSPVRLALQGCRRINENERHKLATKANERHDPKPIRSLHSVQQEAPHRK